MQVTSLSTVDIIRKLKSRIIFLNKIQNDLITFKPDESISNIFSKEKKITNTVYKKRCFYSTIMFQ